MPRPESIESLKRLVAELMKENQKLRRQIRKLAGIKVERPPDGPVAKG